MTTDPILQLVYGTRTLNLNDGTRYALEPGFTPPAALLSVQMSDGTSANRTGGATKIGQRAQNRQWSFSVQCLGSSERDVTRAFHDLATFASYAGIDRSVPLYLEYKPNSDINVKPMWGQDGWLRYEVRHANPPQIGDRYGGGEFRSRNVTALLTIEVAPYAEGIQQRLCTAMGGISEDILGTVDGISRGLMVAESTCNLFTNPVFGGATWNAAWAAGASLLEAQNTDPAYLLPGTINSAKLTARASSANTYNQMITLSASQHAIWSVIKLPDGGTPASTMMQMAYNGSPLTTTFTSASNGFWYAAASAVGTAGSASAGVVVKSGYTIYLAAAQAEKKNYPTPLCWGDLLGCSWSGAAHSSTSTRTAGMCKIPVSDALNVAQGSIRLVWRPDRAYNQGADFRFLFQEFTSQWSGYFRVSTGLFYFYDGVNSISSSAQTFAAGAVLTLHFVWGTGGLSIYLNGTAVASGATYTPPVFGTNLNIGTDGATTNPAGGTFFDFTTFAMALTSTQVANDYANLSQLLAEGKRIGSVPWLWTKDGDNIVDNCNDASGSTGAPHNNWCVCGGVPGSVDARTQFTINVGSAFDTDKALWLSRVATNYFVAPAQQDTNYTPALFADTNGVATAVTDAGGQADVTSVNTSVAGATLPLFDTSPVKGKEIVLMVRLSDAGANLQLAVRMIAPSSGITIVSDYKTIAADATRRLFMTAPFSVPADTAIGNVSTLIKNYLIGPALKRSVAGAANVTIDWIMLFPRPFARILKIVTGIGDQSIFIDGSSALVFNPSTNEFFDVPTYTGDVIQLAPDNFNLLLSMLGDQSAANTITRSMTYTKVVIAPRWSLL